jgi:hypothetical protein
MAKRRRERIRGVPDWQVEFLLSGTLPSDGDEGINTFEVLDWEYPPRIGHPGREVWERIRDQVVPAWIQQHPATRPHGWWLFDSGLERRRGKQLTPNVYGANVVCTLRDSIPENQREWLQERGLLVSGE